VKLFVAHYWCQKVNNTHSNKAQIEPRSKVWDSLPENWIFATSLEKLFQMFFNLLFCCCKSIVTIATFENERINELLLLEARLFNFSISCKLCCWKHGQKGVIHCGGLKNIALHEEGFPERKISVKLKFSKQWRNWRGGRGGGRPPWPVISKFLGPLSPHC